MIRLLRSKIISIPILLSAVFTMGFILPNLNIVYAQLGPLSDDVQIQAEVSACIIENLVHPEKRWPRVGNWDTFVTIWLYDSNNNFITQYTNESSTPEGRSQQNLCDLGYFLPPGLYNFYIRGFSHLISYFGQYTAFEFYHTFIDFTENGQELWAGETSNVFDNKINSLDISTQIRTFYDVGDYLNDFNQDGEVNSLEIGNTIDNFFMLGDPLP